MKSNILLLSLLTLISNVAIPRDMNLSNVQTRACCKKATCASTPLSAPTTITVSGVYCLTKDIIGVITIAADNVILDLNSHEVDGDGEIAAIVSTGFFNVTIKNGSVTNAGSLAISLTDCTGAHIENVNIYESNSAIAMVNCTNSSLDTVYAYDNLNVLGALILVSGSENVQLTNVHANGNTKQLTDVVGTTNVGIGVISLFDCGNATLTDCSVNNNVRVASNSRFAPFFAYLSNNVTLNNVQANNNAVGDDTRGLLPIHIRQTTDVILNDCQANGNVATSTNNIFRGIYLLDTLRVTIQSSQASNNNLGTSLPSPAGAAVDLSGIFTFYSAAAFNNNDVIINNCQVTANQIGTAASSATQGQLDGIVVNAFSFGPAVGAPNLVGRTTISDCQVNDNIIDSSPDFSVVYGVYILQASDVVIDSCTLNGNRGGNAGGNIVVLANADADFLAPVPASNIVISNCTANNMNCIDYSGGIVLTGIYSSDVDIRSSVENCLISNCQTHGNTAGIGGSGIVIGNAYACTILDCHANANSHQGFALGFVSAPNDPNPVSDDVSLIRCSAKENGSNGIELTTVGITNNFLVQDCVSLGNVAAGFFHGNPALTSRFLGNYAKDNGTNFDITGGAIQIFSLDNAGIYTNVSGDAVHFSALVNIDGNGLPL